MFLIKKDCSVGKLNFFIFQKDESGVMLDMHDHTPENDHITIVLQGSIKVTFKSGTPDLICNSGSIVSLEYPHEITTLEDNTKIVNITKN